MIPLFNKSFFVFVLCFTIVNLLNTQVALSDEEAAIRQITESGGRVGKISAANDDQEVSFYLSSSPITDKHLAWIPKVSRVVWLNLANTKISDAGLQHLAGLDSLTRLHLEKTAVSDAGMQYLSNMKNLEYLNLYGTNVSDTGLQQLKALKKLKRLYVWQTQVTESGIKKLNEQLPNLKIISAVDYSTPKELSEPAKESKKESEPKESEQESSGKPEASEADGDKKKD